MAKKQIKEAPSEISPEDAEFETQVLQRNPTRKHIRRFDFPADVEEARAVYMFEQTGKDDLQAAEAADLSMSDAERRSTQRAADAERREGIRLTIIAMIQVDEAGRTVRRHVDQSRPLVELDDWSSKAWMCLRTFFGELNGLPMEELGKAVRGARRLVAATPHATPLQAVSGTPSGG